MKPKKALPSDVDEFFKGTSVFFSPPSTHNGVDKKIKPNPSKETGSSENEKSSIQLKPSSVVEKSHEQHNSVSSGKPNERTVKPNCQTERFSIIRELAGEVKEVEQRRTERFSFEIYIDQIDRIEDVQYRYKKKTGKKIIIQPYYPGSSR